MAVTGNIGAVLQILKHKKYKVRMFFKEAPPPRIIFENKHEIRMFDL